MYALKPSVQELAWSQAEFETVSEDGTRYRWLWVEKRGKNTKLLKCKLGDRMVELIDIIPPKPGLTLHKLPWNPYNIPVIKDGQVSVDDKLLDLDYQPHFTIPDWKPKTQIPEYETVKRVYLDIETLGLEPKKDRIIAIGIYEDGQEPILLINTDEARLLQDAINQLEHIAPKLLIGHNHIEFDIPFIMERCKRYKVSHPFTMGRRPQTMTYASINGRPITYTPVYWKGVDIVDTYQLVGAEDKRTSKFTSYSLKDTAIQIGGRKERRLELSHTEITEYWKSGKHEPILEYLNYDLEDTKTLADYLLPAVYYQSEVVPLPIQTIASASPAKIWEAILEEHYGKDNLPQADEKLSYQGATVSCNPGLYRKVAKVDVSSMYPSIQLRYGICSLKDTDRIYLAVLNYLRTKRFELKKLAKDTGIALYKQRELALKILINGGYGFSGTGGYPMNCMKTAAIVTAYGRAIMSKMIEVAVANGSSIIEIDTDGLILAHDDPQYIFEAIQKELPDGIKIDLDWTDRDVYVPKMKNYIIIDKDGKVKASGEYRKRNRSELQRTFPVNYIKAYLQSPDAAEAYYNSVVEKLRSGDYPVEELSINQRIPKSSKQLLSLGNPGDKITYYWAEQPEYDKYCRKIRGEAIPTTTGDYYREEYVDLVKDLRKEILTTIDSNWVDESEEHDDSSTQLSLFSLDMV